MVPVADEPDDEPRNPSATEAEPSPDEAGPPGGSAGDEDPGDEFLEDEAPDGQVPREEEPAEGPDLSELDRKEVEARAAELADELAQARQEADDYLDRLQRLKADFDNYRKRKQDQVERQRRQARDDLLEDLVEVLDSFDRALDQAEDEAARQGIRMIRKQFLGVLESDGVERVDPEGEPFDPAEHEAVLREATDEAEEGTVLDVLEPGYVRGETVLRPARVKVAAATEVEADEGS